VTFSESQKWITHPEWNQNKVRNLQQIITVQTKTGSMAGTHEYKLDGKLSDQSSRGQRKVLSYL
jgi:hypothetical protein